MVVRIFLIVAVVLGVLVDGFFAMVNFYPVAPHPSHGPKRYVVMQLDDAQAAWFQDNVLDDFNAEFYANLQLVPVANEEGIQAAMQKYGKDVVLAALPVTQTGHAMEAKLVAPFTGVVSAKQITEDFGALGDAVLAPGKVNGAQYFLPRMSVLDVAVFRLSKVRDAVLHWQTLRPQIEAALKKVNGRGLPAGYKLDLTPERWDSYDVFVMGYYWANRSYRGLPARTRIAHRTGDEIDGQQDIASALYRMGGTDATFGDFASRPAVDYFEWEALLRSAGVYPKEMLEEDPFDDEAVLEGLRSGELYFAAIDAMEAFNLHGGSHAGALSKTTDPGDLEFTSLPRGASLALGADGKPARVGKTFSFRENWVWVLPAATSAPRVSYELAKFMWRPDIHARECEALGMLPLHPQVVAERVSRFRLEWMRHVFEAGLAQAGEPVPTSLVGKGLGSVYAQLWSKIVASDVPDSPESGLVDILKAPPAPKPLKVETEAPEPTGPKQTEVHDTAPPPGATEDWETGVVIQQQQEAPAPPAGSGAHK
ncbi:MAG: Extracellular solute-binding protein family 1 [Myxococcales bacterium]|nr:Extracellular solute-binding protein family 1 [Myxococcales bacterium]